MFWKIKKQVAVLKISILMTEKKKEEKLEWIFYIWYLITFKDQTKVLLNLRSEVNIISQVFTLYLNLKIEKTNTRIQKIDDTTLKTYKIVIFTFFVLDKDDKVRFFEESFLLANVKSNIVFKLFFLTISYTNIDFKI